MSDARSVEQGLPAATGPEPGRSPWWRREGRFFVEILAATGFAVAQPVLASFGDSPETFVAAGASVPAIVAFALGVVTVPALVLWGVAALAGLAGSGARWWAQSMVIGSLVAATVLWATPQLSAVTSSVLAALGGVAAVVAYRRLAPARLFLSFAVCGPVTFVAIFLAFSAVSHLVFAPGSGASAVDRQGEAAPLVFLLLDELPTASLLDGTDMIDRRLFPNLAAFADDATFYRNATTVATYTDVAVPAILTGRYPASAKPDRSDFRENLFTLMEGSHELNVHEAVTSLCPPSRCDRRTQRSALATLGRQARDLWWAMVDPREPTSAADAPVDGKLAAIEDSGPLLAARDTLMEGRFDDVDAFVSSLGPSGARPRFDFLHMLLPHAPYETLPGGHRYTADGPTLGLVLLGVPISDTAAQLYRQRHLLQLRYVDRRVGEVMDRLKQMDRYRQATIVVTADHGASFQEGSPHRDATPANFHEILWVPLLVKGPDQTTGAVSDVNVESVDVLPTVAQAVGLEVPWAVDGVVPGEGDGRPPGDKRFFPGVYQDAAGFRRDGDHLLFDGVDGYRTLLDLPPAAEDRDDPLALYRLPPYTRLAGTPVTDLPEGPPAGWSAELDDPDRYRDVRRDTTVLPVYVSGTVDEPLRGGAALVVSVNGVIGGWGRPEATGGGDGMRFAVMVPPSLLRDGANDIKVYALEGEPGAVRLRPVDLVS